MDDLLASSKKLSTVKRRALGALLGAVVADAAGSPLLWIYDGDVLEKTISSHANSPEFHSPTANPYYHVPCGALSHYGDQILPILRSLAECKDFDPANYNDHLIKMFGKGSSYERDYSGDVKYPIEGPYQNSTLKRFNQLYPKGESAMDVQNDTNDEPDCIGRIIPVVMKWAGNPDLQVKAEASTTLLQSNELVINIVGVVSRLMEVYILEDSPNPLKIIDILRSSSDVPSDQKSMADLLQAVVDDKDLSVKEAVKKFGVACALPGSFQASFRSLLDEQGFVPALRESLLVGGSSCSRMILIGCCLGAKYGIEGIPREWIDKTNCAKEVLTLGLQILSD